jgi:hypothetical protein
MNQTITALASHWETAETNGSVALSTPATYTVGDEGS